MQEQVVQTVGVGISRDTVRHRGVTQKHRCIRYIFWCYTDATATIGKNISFCLHLCEMYKNLYKAFPLKKKKSFD